MSVGTMEGADIVGSAQRATERSASLPVDAGCRALDLVVSALMLILLAPLMAALALAIAIDSRGPVLFRQRRVGRAQAPFMVTKFRTMHHGADHDVHRDYVLALIETAAPAPKLSGDMRITRLGRMLRRTSLDELPQLWNVLRGDMSLVGPRPPIPYEVSSYPAHWLARFDVKPGITGVWQVSGRSQVSLEEMIEMDIDYARRRSVWLNLWTLVCTLPALLTMRGAG
jgi:lipopolysaccharide/colanic/teichoic acid biosynthesis glycosyltransferase